MLKDTLETLRAEIDGTDRDILRLCAKRASLGVQIARAKSQSGSAVRDPARERDVLRAAIENGTALGLEPAAVERLYQTLIELSLSGQRAELDARAADVEGEARVAYLGGPGTYSHFAALAHFALLVQYRLRHEIRLQQVVKHLAKAGNALGIQRMRRVYTSCDHVRSSCVARVLGAVVASCRRGIS